jgi:putative ABC transport system permease protein
MELGPIWRASARNKTGVLLIVLQVAFTMALVVNAVGIAEDRAERMERPSGIDEANIFHLGSARVDPKLDAKLLSEEDLRSIRAIPGVRAAVQINAIPLSGSGWSMSLKTQPGAQIEGVGAAVYMVDEQGIDALGVDLVAGQGFDAGDVDWWLPSTNGWPNRTIVSKSLAKTLFPDDPQYGVGKTVYINDAEPVTIVGVMDRLQAPWNGWDKVENSMLVPRHLLGDTTAYLIRAEPGRRDALMPAVEKTLADREPGRVIRDMRTMEQTRRRSYELNRAIIHILVFSISLLVAITALGIGGLTSFAVSRRVKQIGTRRALGGTRAAVIRYFVTENLLFTGLGVGLGSVLAVGINILLVEAFNVPRVPWYLVPLGIAVMTLIGLLAVYFPARRASLVPPAVATRTV